jgi:hypothetical protein
VLDRAPAADELEEQSWSPTVRISLSLCSIGGVFGLGFVLGLLLGQGLRKFGGWAARQINLDPLHEKLDRCRACGKLLRELTAGV